MEIIWLNSRVRNFFFFEANKKGVPFNYDFEIGINQYIDEITRNLIAVIPDNFDYDTGAELNINIDTGMLIMTRKNNSTSNYYINDNNELVYG